MNSSQPDATHYAVIGRSLPRVDGVEKATGRARFAGDIHLPRMLRGAQLLSPVPHARVVAIDVRRASRVPGVRAILTGQDIPDVRIGPVKKDRYVIARDRVRFVGEPVAVVAAEDEDAADEALELVRVEYEPLPAVFDVHEALAPAAPTLHGESNVCRSERYIKGDVAEGFAAADLVIEDTFQTPMVEQCPLETQGAVACASPDGKVSVWASTQHPFFNRPTLAAVLGLPVNKVRIIAPHVGGAFGGKRELLCEPAAALLSMRTGRPVQLVFDRSEEFTCSTVRHPSSVRCKIGVTRDGRLTAFQATILLDTGAYSEIGGLVLIIATETAGGPYRIPHVLIEGSIVYTNNVVAGAFRGFGAVQSSFARESMLDIVAAEIGLDPLEFRLRNSLQDGDTNPTGERVSAPIIGEVLKAVGERNQRYESTLASNGRARGRGLACVAYTGGGYGYPDYCNAVVNVNEDGSATLLIGTPEVGTGSMSALCQIVAEELGLFYEGVSVEAADTEVTPFDYCGANASRITHLAGNAAKLAAAEAREQLFQLAAERLEVSPADLVARDGVVFARAFPAKTISIPALARESYYIHGAPITGRGLFSTVLDPKYRSSGRPRAYKTPVYLGQAVEIEIDPESGLIHVLKVCSVHDVGRAINPRNIVAQVEGGVAQGVGFALYEEMITRQGAVLNSNLLDYKLPGATEAFDIEAVIIESPDPNGPFGAKGMGELGILAIAPAIANAVYDALGVRLKTLPLTPERVLRALAQKRAATFRGER
ncbi:MAG: xanthine dehydrogenase family protein molybdopterin-binding subunit [Candidatus Tectomicrobia bacterium]|nr:xanthine dehydrogenase family protein molybdopterin-binding subunit [Candidatus Tectomicrobia bacterium]